LHNEILDSKLHTKDSLLKNNKVPPAEKAFLFRKYEEYVASKLTASITINYKKFLLSEIESNINRYCRMKAIFPSQVNVNIYESLALLRKIFILCQEHKKKAEAFEKKDYLDISCSIDDEKVKIEKLYKLPIIGQEEGDDLIKFLELVDKSLNAITDKQDKEKEAAKLQSSYTGTLQNEIQHYISHILKPSVLRTNIN
jgi:hypothetical protein